MAVEKAVGRKWFVEDIIKTDNVSGHAANIQMFSANRTF